MILKEKLFLISGTVDDTIKGASLVYDISVFKTFVDFESFVDVAPVIIDTLVVTSDELPFTGVNMTRILNVVNSMFIKIKTGIIYLIDGSCDLSVVNKFFEENGMGNWSVYQGDLSPEFIAEIISGERRDAVEGQVDLVTYRMRADEYVRQQNIKKYESDDYSYETDEMRLSGIPDEDLPISIVPEASERLQYTYIVGEDSIERPLLVFLIAQYKALSGKTLIMERDWEYHRLSDMATKAGIKCCMVDVQDLMKDCVNAISAIRETDERLVVVVCSRRVRYDYNFMMDVLETNLADSLEYTIRECSFEEAPFGYAYTVVMRNTVPDILRTCNSLKYDVSPELTMFVGVMVGDLGPVAVNYLEMEDIIATVLEKEGVSVTVVEAKGILLKGEELTYDLLGIISRGDRR